VCFSRCSPSLSLFPSLPTMSTLHPHTHTRTRTHPHAHACGAPRQRRTGCVFVCVPPTHPLFITPHDPLHTPTKHLDPRGGPSVMRGPPRPITPLSPKLPPLGQTLPPGGAAAFFRGRRFQAERAPRRSPPARPRVPWTLFVCMCVHAVLRVRVAATLGSCAPASACACPQEAWVRRRVRGRHCHRAPISYGLARRQPSATAPPTPFPALL
jgi:hypothetical protein